MVFPVTLKLGLKPTLGKVVLSLGLVLSGLSPSSAAPYGAIGEKYNILGGNNGPLGAALTEEASAPNGGRFNEFKNGFIYWHPDIGAFGVWGAIGAKWNQMGRSNYGYPITDELATPDQRGRFNHFRAIHLPEKPEASIYWTPQTGAIAIYGAIRDKWASGGWERGLIGYPTSDETSDGSYRRSTFERGFIRWSPDSGAQVIPTRLASHDGGGFSGNVSNGLVVYAELPSGGRAELYRDPTLFSHAELCARFLNQPGLDATLRNSLVSRIISQLPSGFGIHSQTNHTTGSTCEARTELWTRHNVSILIRVPNNRLFVRITTPGLIPGSLDPNFVITYDLTIRTTITFPSVITDAVVQGPVVIEGTNVSQPESRSVTGNLVLTVNDIVKFFGGSDFFEATRRGGVAQIRGVNTGISLVNQKLVEYRNKLPQNTRLELFPDGSLVGVLLTNRPAPSLYLR